MECTWGVRHNHALIRVLETTPWISTVSITRRSFNPPSPPTPRYIFLFGQQCGLPFFQSGQTRQLFHGKQLQVAIGASKQSQHSTAQTVRKE